ncbi:MutS2 family protein [Limosilactobacillus coleohominis 101-4-CHN]|uniref:Endonuclease MutS2 n=1 Tax=Limosilactobacillus coleohominis 101-4-CHN TaxID=575594 RepID=C7XWJ3_9LACO|nr:endonuclease MutS2 [Limosilactobacillus coleohominis]EEU29991.1 MutS2 family protein [Limosilactobacillus coleohominis 101-4-CHN]
MNNKILEILEYQRLKHMAVPFLASAAGQEELEQLVPQTDLKTVQTMVEETTDAADINRIVGPIPVPALANIRPQLKRLRVQASLNGTELAQIAKVLQTTLAMNNFFDRLRDDQIDLRRLYQVVEQLVTIPEVTKRLLKSVDEDGRVKDEASSKLHGLRQLIATTETEIRQALEKYTRGREAKYLSDTIITMRNDRYVIPVEAHYRSRFGGVVHDQSASGQTLYIEPQNVVEINNRLRQAQIEERQEVRRVLAELSALIAPYRKEIANNERLLGHLDFVNAKARLATKMHATLPVINDDGLINLRQARHPLIDPQRVVPNDIQLGDQYRTIVITGPNTGGKTITLKTLGLIQLMGQSGFFIPANEGSQITIFDNVFADIGDEQSLEQNLSTFSGHMENVKRILEQITERSLVLLDELGAGTDPKEGAALAMAILNQIQQVGSEVVITTHYPELKVYGFERPQTINASMEFDVDTFQPTYRLMLGVPGQSNGIAIAQRLGLASTVINDAQSLVKDDSQKLNAMIGELVEQRKQARENQERLAKLVAENQQKATDLEQKLNRFNEQRDDLYEKARMQANHQVADAKRKADRIIHHLRQMEVQRGTQIKENELIDAQGQLNALHRDPRLKRNKVLQRAKQKHNLKIGDAVKVKSYGQVGTLIAKRGKHQWEVQLGILKMAIDERDLEKVSSKVLAQAEKEQVVKPKRVRTVQTRRTSARLDLRGQRYEPAMANLSSFIDHALLNNLPSVTIIHGKGTGAIRKGTQEYLRSNPRVKSFEYASPSNGGDGATIVYFE